MLSFRSFTQWKSTGPMGLARRQFLQLAGSAMALGDGPAIAWAQAYPSRPVHLVVGFPAGGTLDVLAHMLSDWIARRGQTFVVENRPGASSNIAAAAVAHAPPDGYMLLLDGSANAINETLYPNLDFDFLRDIAPVAGLASISNVMEVNPSFPAKTVPEFIAYARANPGKINFASSGVGTTSHVSAELFKMMTGIEMVHVAYHGSMAAITDLLGGRVQVYFDNVPTSIGFIKSGKLRALAVTAADRQQVLPDIPTIGESVRGYATSVAYGIGAPKDTPAEIVDILNNEINAFLDDPGVKERLNAIGFTMQPGSPAAYGKLMRAETGKWAKVIKFAGIGAQ
ncbi:MAG TPA: tripartite tricarboxylate transporter substrate binding protein [Xanthobacteraceae bacterium]|nr:tripartite tricarboxylate transporter substrate binding protein [Xanthobacteraceae bacterium]